MQPYQKQLLLVISIDRPRKTWNKFESDRNEVLIVVDFNINLLEINDKHIISEYFDMLTNHSFYPKIILPTRLSNKHGILIDKILCKLSEITLDTTSGVLTKQISDHQPYFVILNNIALKNRQPKFVKTCFVVVFLQNKFYFRKIT